MNDYHFDNLTRILQSVRGMGAIPHVDYDSLDRAKLKFIEASKKTTRFAEKFGYLPSEGFGASSNVFTLNSTGKELFVTLLPEGLGTADDARPEDLTSNELREFWHEIGIKTVSVMTNDAATSGMQSVLISLYLPSSTPETVFTDEFMDGFLGGFVEGCREVGCVYFSGETPQLKTKIIPGRLDIAGAVFGVMAPGVKPIDGSELKGGGRIVLIESSGPHENGFTTLRALAEKLSLGYRTKIDATTEYWRAINKRSVLYTPLVQAILSSGIRPWSMENITGHGWQKIMRSKKPLRYVIENPLPILPIFYFVEKELKVTRQELLEIFNCGAGFSIIVSSNDEASKIVSIAKGLGLNAVDAGFTEDAPGREVVVPSFGARLGGESFALGR